MKILKSTFESAKLGIPLLDESLGGGIPRGSLVLIEDELGYNANILLTKFLVEGLQQGEYGFILSVDHPQEYHFAQISKLAMNPETLIETGRLIYIDAFSSPRGGYHDPKRVSKERISDLSNLFEVNETIRRTLLHVSESLAVRGIIDSFSTMLNLSDSLKSSIFFLQNRSALDKSRLSTTFMLVHADAHDPYTLKALEHLADGVITIKGKSASSSQAILRIVKMRDLDYSRELFNFEWYKGKLTMTKL